MKVEKCIAYPYIRKEENKSIFIQVNFVMQTDSQTWQKDFIWKVDEPLDKEEENEFLKIIDEKYIEFDEAARKEFVEKCKVIFPELLHGLYTDEVAENILRHIYYCSWASGAYIVFYQAGLPNLAILMERLPDLNLFGETPEEIWLWEVDMCFLQRKNRAYDVYLKNRRYLREMGYHFYETFPELAELEDTIREQSTVISLIGNARVLDRSLKEWKKECCRYEVESAEMKIMIPETVEEYLRVSDMQADCLYRWIQKVVKKEMIILLEVIKNFSENIRAILLVNPDGELEDVLDINGERMRLNDADFLFFYFDLVNITYDAWVYFRIENNDD